MEQKTKRKKTSLVTTDDGNEDIQQSMTYAKNSMDRFGDDLCALLVSHLDIEDRFRFECVSKQFQRTVFRSVVDINFDVSFIQRQDFPIFTTMNKIIKKCRNIQTIDFCYLNENNEYFLEVLPEILHKFPNLRQIYCNLSSNSNRWVKQLAPLITRIGDIEMEKKRLLIQCHRLSHLTAINNLLLALQTVIFKYFQSEGFRDNAFEYFVSKGTELKKIEMNMAQQMKHLKTSLKTIDDGNEDNKQQAQIYAKNSMDRFGDDLCALLVSHLDIEDRFRLECVSKQFQRTIFRSVVDIDFDDPFIQREDISIFKTMKKISKKCRNIQTIDFRYIEENNEYFLEVLPEILHKFPNLRQIYCNLSSNSDLWIGQLAPLITRIGRILVDNKQSLIQCHRLSDLRVIDNLSNVFDSTSGQLLVKNLLHLNLYGTHNNQLLSELVSGNQSLKCLCVLYYNTESFTQLAPQLSRLTQLRELELSLRQYENSLSESLRTIGLNCKQLQRLRLILDFEITDNSFKTLDSLEVFQRLKRLDLTLSKSYTLLTKTFSLSIPGQRLTHLIIYCPQIDCKLLGNCQKQWPRLQVLFISCQDFNGQCLDHISRLPALQTLGIHYIRGNDLSDNDFNDLLSRSPKLKNIKISGNYEKKFYLK
ncbi:unnamed protein product [Medioppia subpectinata]|uniref:F-box domain-containing protein n=1 Tax=Medioppia subpectinata TaxID=1979941 RepID=A0A7R9KCG0_9ACAR|nr:unnamed protein product [Medioppia subpectinata]CAG2100923.1 unnamed protein product [Medioppia subpectinata]